MMQKSSAQKGFCAEKSLAINRSSPLGEIRRFENLENKMVYTTRGKCSIYGASSVSVFFLKKVSSREDCAES